MGGRGGHPDWMIVMIVLIFCVTLLMMLLILTGHTESMFRFLFDVFRAWLDRGES